ncbi:MAG: isoprenylcysteine carboxylmethyltransferase family protein [Cyanosarcina radialis HA8281-LM2]|nr:isoprenylcysteine carboxylmethyltransferase family protein [Cyanosarcina radialis HA8281-LM2]
MDTSTLKVIFTSGLVSAFAIRHPYQRENKKNKVAVDRQTTREKALLVLVIMGTIVLPLIYVFSPWLIAANYQLPLWAGYLGAIFFVVALWLFWRSHHDLGKNWSPTLQIREGHTLVVNGIYQKIRHPMYASLWLWCAAQALLIQNWIAGLAGIISFGIMYVLRISDEEEMMLEQFGEEYKAYMQRTKRLIPYLL